MRKRKDNARSSQDVDQVVGRQIRIHRISNRLSQTELADRIGVTFQQVQKYENGRNRVGASRLLRIAQALDVPVMALFDGAEGASQEEAKLLADRQTLRLAQAFDQIRSKRIRGELVSLVESLRRGR
jgi:transcriptional regulator with XRE-family HTH domain